jgi:hypothetical protein
VNGYPLREDVVAQAAVAVQDAVVQQLLRSPRRRIQTAMVFSVPKTVARPGST